MCPDTLTHFRHNQIIEMTSMEESCLQVRFRMKATKLRPAESSSDRFLKIPRRTISVGSQTDSSSQIIIEKVLPRTSYSGWPVSP